MHATMASSTNKNNIYAYDYAKHIQKYYLCILNTNKKWKEKTIILFMHAIWAKTNKKHIYLCLRCFVQTMNINCTYNCNNLFE